MFSIESLNKIFSDTMSDIPEGDIGVGVSGGGDSLALLLLSAEWATKNNRIVKAVTIDHGLRTESASECEYVKKIASDLAIEHTTLKWIDKPLGNLQNSARNARHALLLNWTEINKLSLVLLGHTLDDNAETIMIKLIRGSGIDGLAGISKKRKINGLVIFRPLLTSRREELRQYLWLKNIPWIDEPSNFDVRFDRIKVRKLLPKLLDIGLTPHKLVTLASHMDRAKYALDSEVLRFARKHVHQKSWGDLEIILDEFSVIPKEYQFRLLSSALRWISGKVYRPRFRSLERVLNAIGSERIQLGMCLMGCIIKCKGGRLILSREFSAIAHPALVVESKFLWEKKWLLEVDIKRLEFAVVGPLGKKGLEQIECNKSYSVPPAALICSVAMFESGQVSCLPIISYGSGLTSSLIGGSESFFNFLLTY